MARRGRERRLWQRMIMAVGSSGRQANAAVVGRLLRRRRSAVGRLLRRRGWKAVVEKAKLVGRVATTAATHFLPPSSSASLIPPYPLVPSPHHPSPTSHPALQHGRWDAFDSAGGGTVEGMEPFGISFHAIGRVGRTCARRQARI